MEPLRTVCGLLFLQYPSEVSDLELCCLSYFSYFLYEYRYDTKIFRYSGDYRGVEGQREEEQPPGKHFFKKTETKTVERKSILASRLHPRFSFFIGIMD